MKLRIGTRKSKLALWQAEFISYKFQQLGVETELVEIESFGDKEQDIPIHKLGDRGVFTKALDDALLSGEIDMAVHSLKDVPTVLHPDLFLAAVPKRGNASDTLVKPVPQTSEGKPRIIATGSIRRKAFWKNRFPEDELTGLRGNVPTRLKKVDSNNWYGAIFAAAGLERIGHSERISEVLDWMIPAPSQGAIGILAHKETPDSNLFERIQDVQSRMCVDIERAFMNELEAGCSSPVGGNAFIVNEQLHFKGAVLSVDGSRRMDISKTIPLEKAEPKLGHNWAKELKENGALDLLKDSDDND